VNPLTYNSFRDSFLSYSPFLRPLTILMTSWKTLHYTHTLWWLLWFAGVMCFVVWRYQSEGSRLLECLKEIKPWCRQHPDMADLLQLSQGLHGRSQCSKDKLLQRPTVMSLQLAKLATVGLPQ
jgi:hypothetical protein